MKIQEKLDILLRKHPETSKAFHHVKLGNKAYSRFPEIKLKNTPLFSNVKLLIEDFKKQILTKKNTSVIELYVLIINEKKIEEVYHYFEKHHSIEHLTFIESKQLSKACILKRGAGPQFIFALSVRPKPLSNREFIHVKRISLTIIKGARRQKIKGKIIDFNKRDVSELLELNEMRESLVQVLAFY